MAARRFLVVRHRPAGQAPECWTVEIDGQVHGEYRSQEDALLDAIDLAHEAGQQGFEAEAAFRSERGEYRVAWVFGRDGLPPALRPG